MVSLENGSYIGNATGNRWITLSDTTLTPRLVIVTNEDRLGSGGGVVSFDSLTGSSWPIGITGRANENMIIDLALGSFQIGTHDQVNSNNGSYHYSIIPTFDGLILTGSYYGDSTDARSISGPGAMPDWVILARKRDGAVIQKMGNVGSIPTYFGIPKENVGSNILYMNSGGFAVMNHPLTNNQNGSYYWAALFNGSELTVGSYHGDKTDNRLIEFTEFEIINTVFIKPTITTQTVNPDITDSLTLHLPLEPGVTDNDVHGTITTTTTGAVAVPVNLPGAGSAYRFDGVDDKIQLTGSGNIVYTRSDDFTIGFWLHGSNIGPASSFNYPVSTSKTSNYSTDYIYWRVKESDDSIATLAEGNGNSSNAYNELIPYKIIGNDEWHHWYWVHDGTNGSTYLYMNGYLQSAAADPSAGTYNPSNANWSFMTDEARNTAFGEGFMKGITIWNRALSYEEISMLYNAGSYLPYPFQPKINLLKNLKMYWALDNDANDSHGAFNGSVSGATRLPGYLGSGYAFDGTNDDITGSDSGVLGIAGSNQKTISCWVKADTFDYGGVWDLGESATSKDFSLITNNSDNQWIIKLQGNDQTITVSNSLGSWVNMTMVQRPSAHGSSTVFLYSNGDMVGSFYGLIDTGSVRGFRVGQWNGSYFTGSIDEVLVWNRALNEPEIRSLYAGSAGLKYPFSRNYLTYTNTIFAQDETLVSQGSSTFVSGLIKTLTGGSFTVGSDLNE